MIKVLIADDHKMIRDGLKSMIKHFDNIECIGEAESGKLVLDFFESNNQVDVLLLDINMPEMDGIECASLVSKNYKHIHILALSMNVDHHSISKILKAGASGYILKDSGEEELFEAINKVHQGESFFSPKVTEIMMSSMLSKKNVANSQGIDQKLSEREIEIIRLIADGLTNIEIGEQLFISPRTVDSHRRNLLQKTGAKNSAGLVKYAALKGLIGPSEDDNT